LKWCEEGESEERVYISIAQINGSASDWMHFFFFKPMEAMTWKNIIIISLFCSSSSLHAQWNIEHEKATDFGSYIVNVEKDTLHGDMKYGKVIFGGLLNKVRFKEDGERWKAYKANEISGFSMNGQNYRSMKVNGYSYFMREVFNGDIELHYLEHNYVDRSNLGNEISRLQGSHGRTLQVYVTHDGYTERIYRSSFRDQMGRIFRNRREVLEAIDQNNWKIQDIEQIFSMVKH